MLGNQERLVELTRRVLADEKVEDQEYRELIDSLREGRASGAGSGKGAKKLTELPEDLDSLFK